MRRQPLIIGGGPAGCAAAITLARGGYAPILVDRAIGPTDKVCGDFLGADTIAHVRAFGVDPLALGAEAIGRVRLVHRGRETEAPLPFPALSLSRRRLDQALQAAAEQAGAHLSEGVTVRRLTRIGEAWTVDLRGRQTVTGGMAPPAPTAMAGDGPLSTLLSPSAPQDVDGKPSPLLTAGVVFLATGKHDLRDYPRPRGGTLAVGLKQYLHLTGLARQRLGDATELTLFPGGYAGLQPVESGRSALCIAVRHDAFHTYGGTWDRLLEAIGRFCPRFAAQIAGSRPILPKPLAIAGVPYGFLHRSAEDGLFRLGDQAAVIPSLTGDGLAIALHSGQCAARTWMAGGDASTYHAMLRRTLGQQMRLSGALHAAFLSPLCQPWVLRLAAVPGLLRQVALLTRVDSG